MNKTSLLHFYPVRIAWIGVSVLGAGLLVVLAFLFMLNQTDSSFISLSGKKEKEIVALPLSFSLGLDVTAPIVPIPDLQSEMTFSFDPPRPIENLASDNRLLVRMKRSSESKRVLLPCRLDLEFQRGLLQFAKGKSPFWIEMSVVPSGQIEGKWFIASSDGQILNTDTLLLIGQESPIQSAQEFAENSPFRLLADARWWGRDQFRERFASSGERLEVGTGEFLELKGEDWLIWKDQKWQKCLAPEKELPIAHIQSHSGKGLVLEGWDSDGHVRISLNTATPPPFKMRGEDLFSSIRVRSEKQISCILEKQCMVLKVGDWVLKTSGRWKILRKEQEREAFLNGKLLGDLFVFEQILQKQGQKAIQGRLFNPGRTQMVSIEMIAQSTRKTGERGLRKGKVP